MDPIALFLLFLIIALLAVIVYVALSPMPYPVMPHPIRPRHQYPVMPGFGPYWAHGGQADNSGRLY